MPMDSPAATLWPPKEHAAYERALKGAPFPSLIADRAPAPLTTARALQPTPSRLASRQMPGGRQSRRLSQGGAGRSAEHTSRWSKTTSAGARPHDDPTHPPRPPSPRPHHPPQPPQPRPRPRPRPRPSTRRCQRRPPSRPLPLLQNQRWPPSPRWQPLRARLLQRAWPPRLRARRRKPASCARSAARQNRRGNTASPNWPRGRRHANARPVQQPGAVLVWLLRRLAVVAAVAGVWYQRWRRCAVSVPAARSSSQLGEQGAGSPIHQAGSRVGSRPRSRPRSKAAALGHLDRSPAR